MISAPRPRRLGCAALSHVSDRSLTPHELHQKSISVLDQLARLDAGLDRGVIPGSADIEAVARAAADLRRRIDETVRDVPDAGPVALQHLSSARAHVVDGLAIVARLTDRAQARRGAASGAAVRPDAASTEHD